MAIKKMTTSPKITKTTGKSTVKTTTKPVSKTTTRPVSKTTTKKKITTLPEITVKPNKNQMAKTESNKPTPQDNRMFFLGDPRTGKRKQVSSNEYYRSKEKEGQGKLILRTDPKSGKPLEPMGAGKFFTDYIPMK